jgi:hypothetical protein
MTEAVKELVAAAEECASRRYEPRLSKAVEAVQAQEKPQTHRPAALPHYTDRDEIAEWTPEERSAAESYAWGCQTGGKRPVTLLEVELACQRNRALWALNDVHDFLKSHGYDTTLIDSAIAACTEGK